MVDRAKGEEMVGTNLTNEKGRDGTDASYVCARKLVLEAALLAKVEQKYEAKSPLKEGVEEEIYEALSTAFLTFQSGTVMSVHHVTHTAGKKFQLVIDWSYLTPFPS